jgi:hypothetical protein
MAAMEGSMALEMGMGHEIINIDINDINDIND